MECDDERSGGFEPLRFVPKGKQVVLGLVTTKRGELESKDELKRRIEEAAKYAPLEQLCLSPQCGFSSTVEGNALTDEEQVAKLRLSSRRPRRSGARPRLGLERERHEHGAAGDLALAELASTSLTASAGASPCAARLPAACSCISSQRSVQLPTRLPTTTARRDSVGEGSETCRRTRPRSTCRGREHREPVPVGRVRAHEVDHDIRPAPVGRLAHRVHCTSLHHLVGSQLARERPPALVGVDRHDRSSRARAGAGRRCAHATDADHAVVVPGASGAPCAEQRGRRLSRRQRAAPHRRAPGPAEA